MPFKNPFFFTKRGLDKIDKIREQHEKELKDGPVEPATINNSKTINKLTVGKSRNVHTPVKKNSSEGVKAQEVSNFEVNKPVAAASLNEYPAPTIRKRDVQENIPAVNSKAAPHLVHKTPKKQVGQDFFPVIEKQDKKKTARKRKTGK